ncbi:ComF family protein [Quisquiliibacterium transsilvanicum]|uniref:ComF family protein n=1 Tax=Quisquiliibacterium transsilvanicum TaxID=1549638 RepID=A0A7W8M9K9_9BURK|nr:double zinc ribbon domain-containing protein [Quisquiliibacterium transsilvanicum]MBB5273161.1 ComF family protein [Quisquiliibacterium transsilvanicum]
MDRRHFARLASSTWRSFADRWLPRGCALCDATLGSNEDGLCSPCVDALPGRSTPRCPRCGLAPRGAIPGAIPGAISDAAAGQTGAPQCAACRHAPPPFELTLVLADYAAPIDRLVHALKFGGELALAGALGARMAPLLEASGWPADALVPVPLGAERIATRGFNQSMAIAQGIGRRLGLPVRGGLLARTRETPAQSTLALAERRGNLTDAFRASPAAAGLRLVLVDDVMTSGSTLEAAAAALGTAAAGPLAALVAARTP